MRLLLLANVMRFAACFTCATASWRASGTGSPVVLCALATNASAVQCAPAVRGEPWPPVLRPRPVRVNGVFVYRETSKSATPQPSPARGRHVFPLRRTEEATPCRNLSVPPRTSSYAALANATSIVAVEVQEMRVRMRQYESLLEDLLFAFTDSDDLALLERDAARAYIVADTLTKDRPARLLRTTLLALMRRYAIPLPTSAPLLDAE